MTSTNLTIPSVSTQRKASPLFLFGSLLLCVVLLPTLVTTEGGAAGVVPQKDSSKQGGAKATTEREEGLYRVIFSEPGVGTIFVNFPDDAAAGETITGTIFAEPEGEGDESAANLEELRKFVVAIGDKNVLVNEKSSQFDLVVPSTLKDASIAVQLVGDKKKVMARQAFPVLAQRRQQPTDVSLPSYGRTGRFLSVACPCDGRIASTDYLKVGGKEVLMLAESPRQRAVLNTNEVIGPTQLEFSERGQITKGAYRNISLTMTASKLNLLKGEQATLRIQVRGLENLKEAVPLRLTNRSTSVLTLGGGNEQALTIRPSDVQAGGVYTTERTLTGVAVGAFSIDGIITWKREGNNVVTGTDTTESNRLVTTTLPSGLSALAGGDTPGSKLYPDYTSLIQQDRWIICNTDFDCKAGGQCVDAINNEGALLSRTHSPSGVTLSLGEFFTLVDDDGLGSSPVDVGCPTCDPADAGIPEASQLPRVRLQRVWRSTFDYPGSFGFKMYTSYDYSVSKWISSGQTYIQLQDPDGGSIETFRGRRVNRKDEYTLTSTPDYHTKIAEVTDSHVTFLRLNGQKLRFEWTSFREADGHVRARLQYIADRKGNQTSFSYSHPAGGNTRDALQWTTATDPYGHRLQFRYIAWEGLKVVDQVTLGDGRTVQYNYDASRNKLSAYKVDYGDGIESTITFDGVIGMQNEALLPADHYKQEILLSSFAPGRTRSIKRADGTLLYSRTDVAQGNVNVSLIYDEGETIEIKSSGEKPLISSRQKKLDDTWEPPTTYAGDVHRPVNGISQPDERAWHVTRNNHNERISHRTYPDGSSENFAYNEFSQVTSHTHRSGAVENWKYDAAGAMLNHTEAAGVAGVEAAEKWSYNGRGQVLTHLDFNGNLTRYDYYPNGELHTIMLPSSEGQPGGTITYTYDQIGRVASIADPAKRTTSYKYDSAGRLIRTTYGDGSTEEASYGVGEFSARLLSRKDRNGNKTLYSYDDTGRVRTIRVQEAGSGKILATTTNTWDGPTGRLLAMDVDGDSTEYTYDYRGRVLTTTVHPQAGQSLTTTSIFDQYHLLYTLDPYGRKTSYTYDRLDRITSTVVELTPGGQTIVTRNEYDAEGRLTARIDGNEVRHEYEFDARGRRTLERSAVGTPVQAKESYTYDRNNNLLTITDKIGRIWKKAYTARNQVRTDTNPLGNTVTYAYLPEGLRGSITNANNHVTRYVYDNCCGRLTQEIDADQKGVSYEYDFNGNRTKVRDQAGRLATFEYDGLNRQTKMTVDPLGLNLQTINAYDATAGVIGRKETVTSPAAQLITTNYDGLNRILNVVGDTPSFSYAYDLMDDGLLKQTTTDANQMTRSTLTDGAGRTIKTLDGLSNATVMTYDGNGKLKTMLDRDGRRSRYDYDARSRLTAAVKDEAGINAITRYEFDAVGNLVRIIDAMGQVTAYLYDAANRRTSATYAFSTTQAKTSRYEYWPTGRLRREHKPNGVIVEYAYDNEERLASRTYSTGAADTFTYHPNGLLKTARSGLYRTIVDRSNLDIDYDGANRLIQERQDVGAGAKTVAYVYGPDNLVTGITYPGGPPTPTDCFWHPWHPGCQNLGSIPHELAVNPLTRCSR